MYFCLSFHLWRICEQAQSVALSSLWETLCVLFLSRSPALCQALTSAAGPISPPSWGKITSFLFPQRILSRITSAYVYGIQNYAADRYLLFFFQTNIWINLHNPKYLSRFEIRSHIQLTDMPGATASPWPKATSPQDREQGRRTDSICCPKGWCPGLGTWLAERKSPWHLQSCPALHKEAVGGHVKVISTGQGV